MRRHRVATALVVALLMFSVLPAATASAPRDWRTFSTMYCLKGGTQGGVAVRSSEFRRLRGTKWRVTYEQRPHWAKRGNIVIGRTFVVSDKGPRAHFDMWTPDCDLANEYGGRLLRVRRVYPTPATTTTTRTMPCFDPTYDPWFNCVDHGLRPEAPPISDAVACDDPTVQCQP